MFIFVSMWTVLLLAVASTYHYIDELMTKEKNMTILLIAFLILDMFAMLNITASIGQLYISPHEPFKQTNISTTTLQLLDCASREAPELAIHFSKIKTCISQVSVYNIRNGRLPFLRKATPVAFVMTDIDRGSVFVSSYFGKLPEIGQSLVMIHECAHIALGARDHAYSWQDKYQNLTIEEHFENADSFMDNIRILCTNATSIHDGSGYLTRLRLEDGHSGTSE